VGQRLGGGGSVISNKFSPALAPSQRRRREACGSGVVLEDLFWLGDLRIIMKLHRPLFLRSRLWDRCGLLDPFSEFSFASSNVRPVQRGAVAAACHRHGLEVEDEGRLKNSIVIFFFVEVICIVQCFS
jgi:hypothetical protein